MSTRARKGKVGRSFGVCHHLHMLCIVTSWLPPPDCCAATAGCQHGQACLVRWLLLLLLPQVLDVLCGASEYDELPVRHNEDVLNTQLAQQVGWGRQGRGSTKGVRVCLCGCTAPQTSPCVCVLAGMSTHHQAAAFAVLIGQRQPDVSACVQN